MLEEVGEAGPPLHLAGGAHVEGHRNRRERIRIVDVENDFEAVVEFNALERDLEAVPGRIPSARA